MIESKFCFLREQSGEWYEFRSRRFEMKPGEGKTFISYLALLCYESFLRTLGIAELGSGRLRTT